MSPPKPIAFDPNDPAVIDAIDALARMTGADPESFEGRQITDLVQTAIKLIPDGRHSGELKLLNAALKELRYAFRIFAPYRAVPKISIFGSARTPEDHPDYRMTVDFARLMVKMGWMVITGAGGGIMQAGHEGTGRSASFGVAIRLPFEQSANPIIAGDEKLIHFRYFFTRKLIFVSQANAVTLFPGGFGTQDENFEALTLVQTGKSHMVPIVMLAGGPEGARSPGGYWFEWDRFIRTQLLERKLISAEDLSLYYLARDPADAADHIARFYRIYHSSRYVKEQLVIRLTRPLSAQRLDFLNQRFSDVVAGGAIRTAAPFDEEKDFRELPRIAFHHARRSWGRLRLLIDAINES